MFHIDDHACPGPLLDVPIEGVASAFDTNCLSVLRVCKAVVPHMASRKSGLIVNIGSVVGEMYDSQHPPCCRHADRLIQPGALVWRIRRVQSRDALHLPNPRDGAPPSRDPCPEHRPGRRALTDRGQPHRTRATPARQPLGRLPQHDSKGRHDARWRAQQHMRGGRAARRRGGVTGGLGGRPVSPGVDGPAGGDILVVDVVPKTIGVVADLEGSGEVRKSTVNPLVRANILALPYANTPGSGSVFALA